MGRYLAAAKRGDIRQRYVFDFAAAERRFRTNVKDLKRAYGHAFTVIAEYESWLPQNREDGDREIAILRLFGLFDRPADMECLAALRAEPVIVGLTEPLVGLSDDEWEIVVSQLEQISLVTRLQSGALDAHPLVRQYFAWRLREANGAAAWHKAHGRLFDHLKNSAPQLPHDLQGMIPLYQAAIHACKAGQYNEAINEVLFKRLMRGNQYFSTTTLGYRDIELVVLSEFLRPVDSTGG